MTQNQANKHTRRSVYLKKRPYRKVVLSANGVVVLWLPQSLSSEAGHKLLIRLPLDRNPLALQVLNRQHRISVCKRDTQMENPVEEIVSPINPDDWGIFEDPLLPLGSWASKPTTVQSSSRPESAPNKPTQIPARTAPTKPVEAPEPRNSVLLESPSEKPKVMRSLVSAPTQEPVNPIRQQQPEEEPLHPAGRPGYSVPHVDRQGGFVGFLSRIFKS